MPSTGWLAGAALLAAAVAGALAAIVWHGHRPLEVDELVKAVVGHDGLVRGIVELPVVRSLGLGGRLASLGSAPAVAAGTLGLAAAAAVRRDLRALLCAVVTAPIVTVVVQDLMKPAIERTRYGFLSYPSMHAAGPTALAIITVVLVRRWWPGGRAVAVAMWATVAGVLAVSFGVVYTGFHEPTDVVGGIAVGASIACLVAALSSCATDRDRRGGGGGAGQTSAAAKNEVTRSA